MSYTKHYTTSVAYSGSVSYTFPASEHGGSGTVHYSGSVPLGIDIEVDTDPFDESVGDTKRALAGVAGALSAAELAQVEAIHEAGQKIAQSATRGFFNVLKSEMSSRVAEFSSSMKSCIGLILEQSRAIENVHQQMDADYHAIKGRYQRIFDELDRELDRRIKELDRSAFQLSSHSMQSVVEAPLLEHTARIFTQMSDTSAVPLKLACASTKSRTSDALENLGDVCDLIEDYASSVDSVVDESTGEEEIAFLPAVYAVQRDLVTGEERVIICQGPGGGDAIRKSVSTFVATSPDECWLAPVDEQKSAIEDSFLRRVEQYAEGSGAASEGVDRDRVCRLMLDLYRQAGTKTAYVE